MQSKCDAVSSRKFLVFEECLLSLFMVCPRCDGPVKPTAKVTGTLVTVDQECCACGFKRRWQNQPFLKQMPAGNLLLSAAILFSGSQAAKVLHLLEIMNVAAISKATFFRHQRKYLAPVIIQAWEKQQLQLVEQLAGMEGGLALCGDARSDSPGHCAMYGAFNIIEQRVNKILDIKLVQVIVAHS